MTTTKARKKRKEQEEVNLLETRTLFEQRHELKGYDEDRNRYSFFHFSPSFSWREKLPLLEWIDSYNFSPGVLLCVIPTENMDPFLISNFMSLEYEE